MSNAGTHWGGLISLYFTSLVLCLAELMRPWAPCTLGNTSSARQVLPPFGATPLTRKAMQELPSQKATACTQAILSCSFSIHFNSCKSGSWINPQRPVAVSGNLQAHGQTLKGAAGHKGGHTDSLQQTLHHIICLQPPRLQPWFSVLQEVELRAHHRAPAMSAMLTWRRQPHTPAPAQPPAQHSRETSRCAARPARLSRRPRPRPPPRRPRSHTAMGRSS